MPTTDVEWYVQTELQNDLYQLHLCSQAPPTFYRDASCRVCGCVTMQSQMQRQLYVALRRTKLIPEDTGWQELSYSRCGRTDKGVSALGQVYAAVTMFFIRYPMSMHALHMPQVNTLISIHVLQTPQETRKWH